MNRKAKGNLLQRYVKQILEADGYEVEVCKPRTVWVGPGRVISVSEDFYGKIDLIAVHATQLPRMIQVSVPSELSRKRKLLDGWQPFGVIVEVWLYHGGRGRHFKTYGASDAFRAAHPTERYVRAIRRQHLDRGSDVQGHDGLPASV